MSCDRRLLLCVVAVLCLGPASGLTAQERGDVAIVGGRVVDPASGTDRVRDILIRGDRIVAITDGPVEAERVIDAASWTSWHGSRPPVSRSVTRSRTV
jgi:hypothetical protein